LHVSPTLTVFTMFAAQRFLSAPGPDTKNFTFVTGGDMGTSDETAMIVRVLL
jgi:hypothetical protein